VESNDIVDKYRNGREFSDQNLVDKNIQKSTTWMKEKNMG
jgi:hypothetical protein